MCRGDDDVERIKELNRRIRILKRRDWRQYRQLLVLQLVEAWTAHDMIVCWALARQLSAKQVGPKFQRYAIPAACRPSLQEWKQFMARDPSQRGCASVDACVVRLWMDAMQLNNLHSPLPS
ncbi:MAG: hypothetical protein ACKPKO_54455, partial [Candidatus Fonsibacter sp.]